MKREKLRERASGIEAPPPPGLVLWGGRGPNRNILRRSQPKKLRGPVRNTRQQSRSEQFEWPHGGFGARGRWDHPTPKRNEPRSSVPPQEICVGLVGEINPKGMVPSVPTTNRTERFSEKIYGPKAPSAPKKKVRTGLFVWLGGELQKRISNTNQMYGPHAS